MSARHLAEAILDGGIASVNFFNGRLLTGEDLTAEQTAVRTARRRLGQALGSGVATGLDVTASNAGVARLRVGAGLAVDRLGDGLKLERPIDLLLTVPPAPGLGGDVGFAACAPASGDPGLVGTGLHVLVIGAAEGFAGRAPANGLNLAACVEAVPCDRKYQIDGVRFRLVKVASTVLAPLIGLSGAAFNAALADASVAGRSRLRSLVAHAGFGTLARRARWADPQTALDQPAAPPSAAAQPLGLSDVLRGLELIADCEVPLAVVDLGAAGAIRWLDAWSVRRRVTAPEVATRWPWLVSDRLVVDGEACFEQFQDHIGGIVAAGGALAAITALSRLAWLPPLGIIPMAVQGGAAGFVPATFFGTRAAGEIATLDATQLRTLTEESWRHEAIDLAGPGQVQCYVLWENLTAVAKQQAQRLSLVFASSSLPFRGAARFGFAHFNLSRFAPAVIQGDTHA